MVPPNANVIFGFADAKTAEAFRAVIKNRFGLGAVIYRDAKASVHVMGDDTDDGEIRRQVMELARWLGASSFLEVS